MRESKSLDLEGQAAWQPWPEAEDGIHSAIPTPVGTPGLGGGLTSLDTAGGVGSAATVAEDQQRGDQRDSKRQQQHKRSEKMIVAIPNPEVETETLKTPVCASPSASTA